MAASRSRSGSQQPDIDIRQIIAEAQSRWLRPVEVCEILKNYAKYGFKLNPVPPVRPCSGSMFLFDRKTLRYFRKDGHNWRKKKDGKTVREAHERLKTGSVDVLHCYYAHGEDNSSFQRRCYWMLDPALEHIVLVHYREVTEGGRFTMSDSQHGSSAAHAASPPDVSNPATPPELDQEDTDVVESEDIEDPGSLDPIIPPNAPQNTLLDQLTPRAQAAADLDNSPVNGWIESDLRGGSSSHLWMSSSSGVGTSTHENLLSVPTGLTPKLGQFPQQSSNTQQLGDNQFSDVFGAQDPFANGQRQEIFTGSIDVTGWNRQMMENNARNNAVFGQSSGGPFPPQNSTGAAISQSVGGPTTYVKQESMQGTAMWSDILEQCTTPSIHRNIMESLMGNNQVEMSGSPRTQDLGSTQVPPSKGILEALSPRGLGREPQTALEASLQAVTQEKALKSAGLYQRRLCGMRSESQQLDLQFEKKVTMEKNPELESFPKLDSFGRWMTHTLEGQNFLSPGAFQTSWPGTPTMGFSALPDDLYQIPVDASLSTSVAADQRYSITDSSPEWAYATEGAKVLVSGVFLGDYANTSDVKWHCMFGEVEVPAEVISGGVLRCIAPPHAAGRVLFYVTCGDRQAHSEIREFEYRAGGRVALDNKAERQAAEERLFKLRLAHLLLTESDENSGHLDEATFLKQWQCLNSFSSSHSDADWQEMETLANTTDFSQDVNFHDRLLQVLLKARMQKWLLSKIQEEGKGASVLDVRGQGVLHMAAALGYDWVISPLLAAGVPINFRDARGWTALHWAASFGKEQVVVALLGHGADPGTVTDPTPSCPSGQTPADLALMNGHVGIGGFLAESSLTRRLSTMSLKENPIAVANAHFAGESAVAKLSRRDSIKQTLSNRSVDSLSIKESYKPKFDEYGMTESQIRGFVAARAAHKIQKAYRGHQEKKQQLAASRIQNKYRSWKVRKDYVNLRQRVVKIQAHVRGNLVRRRFRKLLWSVGVLDKVILRWRRKRSGLRGFKSGDLGVDTKEDDEEFLKEGRILAEKAVEKAVTTVQSMVRSQPARDQYMRLREGSLKAEQSGQFHQLASPQELLTSPDVEYNSYEEFQNQHMNQYLESNGDQLMSFAD
nr:calmodulin-binding transcription activator 3-like [Physcomitrium patens]|eukprot:XP_024370375.1 calmodulin-binding transcription activator 3-like [Physcomitrella patens]